MTQFAYRATRGAALLALLLAPWSVEAAEQRLIEEIVVTARQQQEGLQDVPVTIAAFTEEDLDRYNITTLTEASDLVPNFQIFHGGSGNGSNLILRGIGSSSISAAFDQSVAINVDGVVVNIGRFIHNAYMDMHQLEVLKGPQSLYFGKSATAGVVSVMSNDPGDEFEAEAMVGYEPEYDQTFIEGVISVPVTDTFGARLAVGRTKSDELFKNLVPGVAHKYRGERELNARLTLLWEPTENFRARLKYSWSEYHNDGSNGRTEEICPEGRVQPTAIPAASFALAVIPGIDDCDLNGNTSIADVNPALRAGLPFGGDNGIPFLDQTTNFVAFQMDWSPTDYLDVTSVTGYVDLGHVELDVYDYSTGVFNGLHRNTYDAISQEVRAATSFDFPLNFQVGLYYQGIEQEFNAFQYAFNLGLLFGPDPATGFAYDYNKNHFLNTTVYSTFVAGYWDITDHLQLTAGFRYTNEDKDGKIKIPYLHQAAALFGFGAPALVDGLKFEDDNISPEVAINWNVTDNIALYASYKEGFKSGGIDNSALPTASLQPTNPDFPDFLIYKSEEAQGYEGGIKAQLADGRLRLNASAFSYSYDDLQVQLFDSNTIQFKTFNASSLVTRGLEFDYLYVTELEGLVLRGAWAFTDTEYDDTFINATGEDLEGQRGPLSAKIAGSIGATYDRAAFHSFGKNWRVNTSLDLRYNDGYPFSATLDPYFQTAFWLVDASIRLYSEDERYELALIGRNLTDHIYAQAAGARPGACGLADPGNPNPAARCTFRGANKQDQVTTTSLGAQYRLEFRVRL